MNVTDGSGGEKGQRKNMAIQDSKSPEGSGKPWWLVVNPIVLLFPKSSLDRVGEMGWEQELRAEK